MNPKYHYQKTQQFRPSPGADLLRQLYVDERRGVDFLMQHFRTSIQTLRRWLAEAGIPIRKTGEWHRKDVDQQAIAAMYTDQQMSMTEIMDQTGYSQELVQRVLRETNTPRRPPGPRLHKRKKPTKPRVFDPDGYALVHRPDHPRANAGGYVREHILVAEQTLGRPIAANEVVHHEDEDKSNNDPSNLRVFASLGDHIRHHNLLRSSCSTVQAMSDSELRALYAEATTVEIAKRYHTSPASVQRELKRRGIPTTQGRRSRLPVESTDQTPRGQ